MKRTKASASDFDALLGGADESKIPRPKPVKKTTKVAPVKSENEKRGRGRPTTSENDYSTTIHYPSKWRKRLREQAVHEDKKVNDLYVEALSLLFANRGIDPENDNS